MYEQSEMTGDINDSTNTLGTDCASEQSYNSVRNDCRLQCADASLTTRGATVLAAAWQPPGPPHEGEGPSSL